MIAGPRGRPEASLLQVHHLVDQRREDLFGGAVAEVAGIHRHRDFVSPGPVRSLLVLGAEMAVTAPAAGVSDQGARQAIAEQRCVEVVERRLELAQGLAGWIDLSRGARGHICIVLYNLSRLRQQQRLWISPRPPAPGIRARALPCPGAAQALDLQGRAGDPLRRA